MTHNEKRGYPTPDDFSFSTTTRCVPIPDDPTFIAIIGAQLFEATQPKFWRKLGTMDEETAADYMAQAVALYDAIAECGGLMSCEQVQDCIETDEGVLTALISQMTANGFSPSGNALESTDVTLTDAQKAGNLLPEGYSCEPPQAMATARKIVQEFNEASNDFFESVETITNAAELGVITTDGIPIADTLNNIAEFVDWLIQTMREIYQASYNQEVEDELTCAVFCAIMSDCSLSYDDLLNVWETYADPSVAFPENTDDFQELVDWATSLTLTISTGTVATHFYLLTQAMKFGSGTVFEIAGLTSLKSIIGMTVGYFDQSYTECDDCPTEEDPTDFWMIYENFETPSGIFDVFQGTSVGNGIRTATSGSFNQAVVQIDDLGDDYVIVAMAMRNNRIGGSGSGTNDVVSFRRFPDPNQGGTLSTFFSAGFLGNAYDRYDGFIYAPPNMSQTGQSFDLILRVSGTLLFPTRFGDIREAVMYGLCNSGQVKPPQAIYVDAIPSTVEELFP